MFLNDFDGCDPFTLFKGWKHVLNYRNEFSGTKIAQVTRRKRVIYVTIFVSFSDPEIVNFFKTFGKSCFKFCIKARFANFFHPEAVDYVVVEKYSQIITTIEIFIVSLLTV